MKIRVNEIAEIYEYEDSCFYLGKILCSDNQNFVFFNSISPSGDYQGWALLSLRNVERIIYSTKYINFYKKVLKDNKPPLLCSNPKDFLEYCFVNKRIVEISKFAWGDRIKYLKLISINETSVKGQTMDSYGRYGQVVTIDYNHISWILFGSSINEGIEEYVSKLEDA